MKEKEYVTGYCPSCFFRIDYCEEDGVVQCPACEVKSPTSSVLKTLDVKAASHKQEQGEQNVQLYQSINNPESALAYLENFFENYDWEEYNFKSQILISSLEAMVAKQKVTNAAIPNTWKLEFESIIVPLMHKIDGLKSLERQMANKYDPVDDTNIYDAYDNYKRILARLLSEKEDLVKRLVLDVKYAEKYQLAKDQVEDMKKRIVILDDMYKGVVNVRTPQELPLVAKKIKEIETKVVNELAKQGINAAEVYENALSLYVHNNDKTLALNEFSKIKQYKDSSAYITKINRLFNFDNELIEIGGFKYSTRPDSKKTVNVEELNENNAPENDEQYLSASQKGFTTSLYEIVDGKPANKPTIMGISSIIDVYGSSIYYVKNNSQICVFDTVTQLEDVLDKGRPNCYKDINNDFKFYFSTDGLKFFFKKKLEVAIDEPGCFAKLMGKKPVEIKNNNNYSIKIVNMQYRSCKDLVNEVIDILDYFEDKLFYTYAKDPESTKEEFKMCDVNTNETKNILDINCVIHTIYKNKVIFSRLTPNRLNKDLYCLDLATEKELLLEDNIYNFFKIIDDKIYYTIGNDDFEPLLAINFDGTDRREILPNVIDILMVRAGWMYVVRGYGVNKALIKISTDGKRRFTLCTRISEIIKFIDGFVYYLDTSNDLHIVRNDGKDDSVLIESVDPRSIITDSEKIYFLRKEKVGKNYNHSLYSIDLEGNGLKKLQFDVLSMKEYDESNIYLSKNESIKYKITKTVKHKVSIVLPIIFTILAIIGLIIFILEEELPLFIIGAVLCIIGWISYAIRKSKNKDTITSFEELYSMKKFYAYNKVFKELQLLLTIGEPDLEDMYNKNAPKNVYYTFEVVPRVNKYYRKNIVEAGSNFNEKHQEFVAQQQKNTK